VNPESIKLGHEPDRINAKTILYVPIALVVTFAMTYTVVSLIINNTRITAEPRPGNPQAAERNRTPKDQPGLNKRLASISSTDPNAAVKAPRLEGLTQMTTLNAPYLQSSQPTKEGNSPQYYPEAMRATSALAKEKGLQSYAWVEKKESVVRVPVAEVMKLLIAGADDKNVEANKLYMKTLKFEDKVKPTDRSGGQGTGGNPHQGSMPAPTGKKTDAKEGGH